MIIEIVYIIISKVNLTLSNPCANISLCNMLNLVSHLNNKYNKATACQHSLFLI